MQAHKEFEAFLTNPKRFNTKQLCIEAYEDILLEKR
jgi:hypothetical protein